MPKDRLATIMATVIARGYAKDDEYKALSEKNCTKFQTEAGDESFWGVELDAMHVLLCNSVLDFLGGPRDICGMVAIHKDHRLDTKASIARFKAAGQEAIDYYHRNRKPK